MSSPNLPPPFINVAGIANFRDIGNDTTIRKRLVYRSADPSKATPDGLKQMSQDLGITTIFDLRSTPEILRDGPEWSGVEIAPSDPFQPYAIQRNWTPVFAAKDYGPEQVAIRYKHYANKNTTEGFVKAYQDILLAGTEAYTKIFRHLANHGGPCLVHCTAGKDRTGVLVALLFLLVGEREETIADEYSLTDKGLEHLKPLFEERLLKNPALGGNLEGVRNMTSSKRENMLATIEMIRREVGSAEQYMREKCGMSEEEVERLRRNLRPV
ncbi:Tyrosine- phosphatase [Lecanosticta acicola]|uniref:Tyrosine- phosphatase n=1 Tax=Lecanosticta acicola TaxID=111012 RepID=A0AAI9EAD2_9PEZI|nr:Tyrosine- phosphatase [Lecanosticta acicola]